MGVDKLEMIIINANNAAKHVIFQLLIRTMEQTGKSNPRASSAARTQAAMSSAPRRLAA